MSPLIHNQTKLPLEPGKSLFDYADDLARNAFPHPATAPASATNASSKSDKAWTHSIP